MGVTIYSPRVYPWKNASRSVAIGDGSVVCYVKYVGPEGLTAGSEPDQATLTDSTDLITVQVASDGGALANETGIDYTSNSGSAGTLTLGDTNANSPQDLVNVFNGVGVGQTAFSRVRAALGDIHPTYVLTTGDTLDISATNILLGRSDAGLALNADTSNLALGGHGFVGIGTAGGCKEGSGAAFPDYFEDIPGSSSTASVNTAVRSAAPGGRKRQEAIVAPRQYRITGWSMSATLTTTPVVNIRNLDGDVIFADTFVSGGVGRSLDVSDYSAYPIEGPVGEPIFFEVSATTLTTAGTIFVRAESRIV